MRIRIRNIAPLIIIVILMMITSCKSGEKRNIESFDAFNLGVKSVKSENLDLAKYYFQRAIILNPNFVEAKLNLANVQFLKGELDDARELYSALLAEKQFDPRLLYNLGWIYMVQEDFETANDLFLKSRKADVNFYDSDYGLAQLSILKNQPVMARFYLEKYMQEEPDGRWTEKSRETLALLPDENFDPLQDLDIDPVQNEEDDQIQEPDPTPVKTPDDIKQEKTPVVEEKIPVVVEPKKEITKKPEKIKAPPVVKKKPPEKPAQPKKSVSALIVEGRIAFKKGDFSNAEKSLNEAWRRDKKSTETALLLAKIYYRKKSISNEKKYLFEYLKLSGKNKNDQFDLASGYELIGDYSNAIVSYRNYLVSSPFGENAKAAKEKLTELDKLNPDS